MAPGLDAAALVLLGAAAFLTAALSAVVGLAGGITLLAVMLLVLDPLVAIPLHGIVQLVSNGSRTWVYRTDVRRELVAPYAVLLLPMALVGLAVATRLPEAALRVALGVFIVVATWTPGALLTGARPAALDARRRFVLLGGMIGFLGPTIGATGPLLAPFFLNLGLTRFEVIGTAAACQVLGHLSKVIVFGAAGFAFGAWTAVLALLTAMVMAGTWAGSRVLARTNERAFTIAYRVILTAIALRLVATALGV